MGSYNGEDVIIAFGGYNGHYNNEVPINTFCPDLVFNSVVNSVYFANQVNVFKPSHKSSLKSKIMGASPMPDSFSAVNNATTRDIESEIEVSQEGKVREIVMDNVNSRLKVASCQIFLSLNTVTTMHFLFFLLCILDTKSSG